jgi:hypothetical protein
MERGKLSEVYRTRPVADGGGVICLGPYYKLQTWEDGRNHTRHVPVAELPALQEDLANHRRFAELSAAYEASVIARSRALRAQSSLAEHAEQTGAKKSSSKRRAAKSSPKP